MGAAGTPDGVSLHAEPDDVQELIALVRRVVSARVRDPHLADDLVQETLARVLAARSRVEPAMVAPYAFVTARNLVASTRQREDRHKRHQHRILDLRPAVSPAEDLIEREERLAVSRGISRLSQRERKVLLAHEVDGQNTASLASDLASTSGAVAAQLHRARGRLRVEYLIALEHAEPPTQRCRPVLLALSLADRRRQRELDAARHLLECEFCAHISEPLVERREPDADGVRIPVSRDADVVLARQNAREIAASIGFSRTELTLIATAVSEVTRNIVRFAEHGEIVVTRLRDGPPGIRVVARDVGPGIADVDLAMTDGYSTYQGLGLGLPGARRLMDDFDIVSESGKGTTVTMTKWHRED